MGINTEMRIYIPKTNPTLDTKPKRLILPDTNINTHDKAIHTAKRIYFKGKPSKTYLTARVTIRI